jgi:hypothetical protein
MRLLRSLRKTLPSGSAQPPRMACCMPSCILRQTLPFPVGSIVSAENIYSGVADMNAAVACSLMLDYPSMRPPPTPAITQIGADIAEIVVRRGRGAMGIAAVWQSSLTTSTHRRPRSNVQRASAHRREALTWTCAHALGGGLLWILRPWVWLASAPIRCSG